MINRLTEGWYAFRFPDMHRPRTGTRRLHRPWGQHRRRFGQFDVIFCRNVLIYFDTESRKRVIETFYERLQPGGYLMLGHSESLLHLSTAFELAHLSSDMVYRKPVHTPTLERPREEEEEER